ncbi:Uu.00g138250.m01.CDS01 [Anthostomella pinea]|uniref:Uu.00g138250.m01.CDS01 n=1 Tax=Anthostomella pinea TaxID=933095 RepID=A0AAI8VQB2_9PEZI|nr:Uu.00g138250.m01.CDS01 [Anthostomella pinea]
MNPPSHRQEANEHAVSWQSAAGALVALAVNVCLQDSGDVLSFPKELAVFAHSSPVICLVDSLVIVLQVLIQSISKGGLAQSVRDVAAHRHQLSDEAMSLNGLVKLCMLLALCITQTTKLFALKGVPWTQLLGACYLLCYVVNAILNTLGPHRPQNEALRARLLRWSPSENWMAAFTAASCLAQLVIGASATSTVMPSFEDAKLWYLLMPLHWPMYLCLLFSYLVCSVILIFAVLTAQLLLVVGPILLWCIALLLGTLLSRWLVPDARVSSTLSGVMAPRRRQSVARGARGIIVAFVMVPSVVSSSLLWQYVDIGKHLPKDRNERLGEWIKTIAAASPPYISLLVMATVIGLLSWLLVRVILKALRQLALVDIKDNESEHVWLGWLLLITNIGFALLFYTRIYRLEGTYKPPWAENLG